MEGKDRRLVDIKKNEIKPQSMLLEQNKDK